MKERAGNSCLSLSLSLLALALFSLFSHLLPLFPSFTSFLIFFALSHLLSHLKCLLDSHARDVSLMHTSGK